MAYWVYAKAYKQRFALAGQFLVAFSEIPGYDGEQAFRVLDAFADEVERVLLAIEAESRRLRIYSLAFSK